MHSRERFNTSVSEDETLSSCSVYSLSNFQFHSEKMIHGDFTREPSLGEVSLEKLAAPGCQRSHEGGRVHADDMLRDGGTASCSLVETRKIFSDRNMTIVGFQGADLRVWRVVNFSSRQHCVQPGTAVQIGKLRIHSSA